MSLNEAALRWVNDFSAVGILMTDAGMAIRGWNHWLESRTGRSTAEMIGLNLFDEYPALVTRGLDKYYEDALAGQVRVLSHRFHRFLIEMPALVGDHEFFQMQQTARIAPLIADGRVVGTITIIEDVTERVGREERLARLLAGEQAARREAEEANRAKDEFLATVSHELRTPLNAIYGWIQIMRKGEMDEEILSRGLDTIERNLKVQTKLIEDILDVSRIVSGKLSMEAQPFELVSAIRAALDSVRPAADAKRIKLRTDFATGVYVINGDSNRMQQVVWNLISNAIKFTPEGGSVDVRLRPNGNNVDIEVADTGQGISADFLPYVFDRFRQADGTTTRRHGGLGLGLAIVRHLVEMHGGTVEAQSKGAGEGATFTVRLPMVASRKTGPLAASNRSFAATAEAAAIASPDGAASQTINERLDGLKILVVDDEEDAREMLKLMLKECGAEVRLASNVQDAMEALQTWKPDVVLSDVGMPSEDGYSLINRIKALAQDGYTLVPAVALTGYARPEDRARLLAAGFQAHLAKPVSLQELFSTLASVVGRLSEENHEVV